MPDIFTANYEFVKPEIGGSDNSWGAKWNANLDAIDATLKELAEAIVDTVREQIYPIDSTLITRKSGNPATWLGFGTWVEESEGRAVVGVGTADGVGWSVGQKRGEAYHTLSVGELPSHDHNVNPPSTSLNIQTAGAHKHRARESSGGDSTNIPAYGFTGADSTYTWNDRNVESDGSHDHAGTVNIAQFKSEDTGSGNTHNNLQPSEAFYIWRRTA